MSGLQAVLNDLVNAKAVFQLRAIMAAMGMPDLSDEAMETAVLPILIEVRGGMVVEVSNLPPGYLYEVKDWDDLDEANDCPICGEDHQGAVPLACETGDGV